MTRINALTQTANETDIKAGNYFAIDCVDGTKKLPADKVAKKADYKNFNRLYKCEDTAVFTVKYGGINESSGDYGVANLARVGRKNDDFVSIDDDYEFMPFYYSSNTEDWAESFLYHGSWCNYVAIPNGVFVAISIRKKDGSEIKNDSSELNEISAHIHYYNSFDKSLTKEGCYAESKSTGDKIDSVNDRIGVDDECQNEESKVYCKYIDTLNESDTYGTWKDSTQTQRSYIFKVEKDSLFRACGRVGTADGMSLVCYYKGDEINSLNYLGCQYTTDGNAKEFSDVVLNVPSEAKFVVVQGNNATIPKLKKTSGLIKRIDDLEKWAKDTFYAGKYLSVMGASTCTYSGYIPTRNKTYYPKGDVDSVNKMWWQRVCDSLGMNRLVIEAWSGSKVSDIDAGDDYANFVPMADNSRCKNLHTSEHNPDVIIIQGGINDFSKANDVLGTWNGGTFPATISTFRDAFATMLNNINNQYPHAMIFVVGLPQFVRTKNEMQGVEISANENKSFSDYNRAMMDMCDMFGCNYISLNGIYSRIELTDGTIADSSTYGKTHPNAEGHRRWAERIVKNMLSAAY